MFFIVSPTKEVMRFDKKGEISGVLAILFHTLWWRKFVMFPSSLSFIHWVFHVLLLRKCIDDPSLVVSFKGLLSKIPHLMG